MKFAKELEQTLADDEIPEEWVEAAIQYKALKKCIGRVVKELNYVGLERNTLKLLLENIEINEKDTTASNPIVAKYVLKKSKIHNEIVPSLKIVVDYNEELTDDYINESITMLKKKLENIVVGTTSDSENNEEFLSIDQQLNSTHLGDHDDASTIKSFESDKTDKSKDRAERETALSPRTTIEQIPGFPKKYTITIKLRSDAKFFHMLNEELLVLDQLRNKEEERLIKDIQIVSNTMNELSTKESLKKGDMYKWRELFRMFIDSEIYFKTNNTEVKTFQNSSDSVEKRLEQFKENVNKTKILTTFKNKKSLNTFQEFLYINERLLRVLKFQSINSKALTKILKKFDKQTSLNVKMKVPNLITPDHIFMNGSSISKTICSIIQTNILTVIPQLDDYLCPICADIAYKPIRLSCNHVFCVRCMVKHMQANHDECPLCKKSKAVEEADSSNIDVDLALKMVKFFPKETKAKLKERQKERYNEFANTDSKCIIT
ncbi:transcriptional regulator of yeast form adherence 3 [[Candida] jaroonii]|uniref:Transcriptional regulator of yeast form adherence 3 n=1 Tax=[Candida] jaroonii TaxID=467808 RepID=A0ACA9Y094_9ASCO|nr:transcriptional regulator of yeast form adherence 3 [[Candida] jaroonii]